MVLRGLKPKKLQNIMAPNKLSMSAAKSKSLCRVKFMVTHRIGSTLLKLGHINNHRVRRFHTRKPNKGNATSNLLHYHCQIMFLTIIEFKYRLFTFRMYRLYISTLFTVWVKSVKANKRDFLKVI